MQTLNQDEARRIIVNAHLGRPAADALEVLRNERVIQLDGISRVEKSHRLACAARLPPGYHVAGIDRLLWSESEAVAFETYTHAACLFPIEDWPLLALARQRARSRRDAPPDQAMARVLEFVADCPEGATIAQIEAETDRSRSWEWSLGKRAAEHLIWRGKLICSSLRGTRRVYDLPQRRVPARILQLAPTPAEILEHLTRNALVTLGVATAKDIARHYNIELNAVEEGLLIVGAIPIRIEGWDEPGYVFPETDSAGIRHGPRLIGPFDNLLRNRARALRAFGFDYIFEAYKPARTRIYGAYTMAVLDQGRFVGRVDAQRAGRNLSLLALFPERGEDTESFAQAARLAGETLASQLGGALTARDT